MQPTTQLMFEVASALWRSRKVILIVAIVSTALGWLQQTRTPQLFEADTALLYRFGRGYFPINPVEQPRNWSENVEVSLDAAILTEMRLLSSHQLFERTLAKVGISELQRRPTSYPAVGLIKAIVPSTDIDEADEGTGDRYLAAVRNLAEMFVITRYEGAAVVHVAAQHPVPDVADTLANTHIETYFEWRDELFNQDQSAYFDKHLRRMREEHEVLVLARNKIKRDYGIFDYEAETELARQELAEAESRLAEQPGEAGLRQDALEARAKFERLELYRRIAEPLDARIRTVLDNLTDLEVDETNWRLTRDFGEIVAPVATVIDQRTANNNPIGQGPGLMIALAGLTGAVLASLGVAVFFLVACRSGLSKPARDLSKGKEL